ncbi:hypothetical protein [Streptomyces sp. NPDC086989]|uniref:hypothetical protein n=1 Tax=Streptomyces sp. NPDC086989 TaxID=3365764 RepID=UPI00380E7A96
MNAPVPHPLISAAAYAAGTCTPGLEAAWRKRVRRLAIDLHLDAVQVAADIARIEGAKDRVRGILTRVEMEEVSNRGLIYVKPLGRMEERFRTDRLENDAGKEVYALAQSLVGRFVRVYKDIETTKVRAGQERPDKVRVAVHLVDLGPVDGAVPEADAKDMMIRALGGDKDRAAAAWRAAGLPNSGSVGQEQLEAALAGLPAPVQSDGE